MLPGKTSTRVYASSSPSASPDSIFISPQAQKRDDENRELNTDTYSAHGMWSFSLLCLVFCAEQVSILSVLRLAGVPLEHLRRRRIAKQEKNKHEMEISGNNVAIECLLWRLMTLSLGAEGEISSTTLRG